MKISEKKDNRIIYMDYAATSPMKKEVIRAMELFWGEKFGNPSSIHSVGRQARSAIDEARNRIANILGSNEQELYFTSGGTESNNLAIAGVTRLFRSQESGSGSARRHIITTQIEHQSILKTFQGLEKEGFEVTYLPVNDDGIVNVDDLQKAIRPETALVSVMYVNNEIGTVQPIQKIANFLKSQNVKRKTQNYGRIYLHIDAVQAPEYFSINVARQCVDMMSLSAHKFGGPKGVGVLYVKREVPIFPMVFGGEQELALRPGTENVAGVIGMAKALRMAADGRNNGVDKQVLELRNYFEKRIEEEIDDILVIAQRSTRSPGIVAVVFGQIDPVALVMNLDLEGICVSSGAACSTGSVKISHVIEALKLNEPYHNGAVRFCFSRVLSKEQIDSVVLKMKKIIERLRLEMN